MERKKSTRNVKINKKIWLIGMILVFSIFFLNINIVNATWWDGNWPYLQTVNISTSSGITPENYSVKVMLNSTNVGSGFNWNNECVNNVSKIRIVDENNTLELPYWVKDCDPISKNMTLWIKIDKNISTSGYLINMYYGNNLATLKSDANNTFELYLNLSTLSMVVEGAGQDISGNGVILDSGRTFHTWGNSWKIFTGFGTYNVKNNATQILEMDFKSSDCGEIAGFEIDTDTIQSNLGSYRWCGTQTSWGVAADGTYSGSGNWEEVYTIFNDDIMAMTHIHLPIDDDADSSGDVYYKDIRVRKYVSNEPTFLIGIEQVINTTLISMSPENIISGNLQFNLTCIGATANTTTLSNMSLYGNWGSGWHLNQTINISGNINSTIFNITLENQTAKYNWTCVVYDNSGSYDFFEQNYTIEIDKNSPEIILNSPLGTIGDVTPTINVSFSKNVSSWYNINNGMNYSLCNNCSFVDNYYLHLAEGNYSINIFANDSYGNFNSSLNNSFIINMNNNYYDNFEDNSSVNELNTIIYNSGNLTYSGSGKKYYNGIEIGYKTGNLNYFTNQWEGAANAGELDITCPGGDSACWFETQNHTNITSINIINGAGLLDGASTVGFLMYSASDVHTRLTPVPHAQNGNNLLGICYVSGLWYYDDNNGCNKPFTPVDTDIIIANVTWGMGSVTPLNGTINSGGSNFTSKSINTTYNITSISNITWTEINTDLNNNISVQVSVDNGLNWHNINNSQRIDNLSNNFLVYRVFFNSDGTKVFGISDINITWENNITQVPTIELISPLNQSNNFGNGSILLEWNITDNEVNLSCELFIDLVLNKTLNCTTGLNSINLTFEKGLHIFKIRVNDTENNSINSSTNSFNLIFNSSKKIIKKISSINSNLYLVNINVSNLVNLNSSSIPVDFVSDKFNSGSFSTIYDFLNITSGPKYVGNMFGWNASINSNSSLILNYSITNIANEYNLLDEYIIGLD